MKAIFKPAVFFIVTGLLLTPGCGKSEIEKQIDGYLQRFKLGPDARIEQESLALVKLGQAALPYLVKKLKDTDLRRYEIAYALGKMGGQKAEKALVEVLNDEDTLLCIIAVNQLTGNRARHVSGAVIRALDNDNDKVRLAAFLSLLETFKNDLPQQMLRALGRRLKDKIPEIKEMALNELEKNGSDLAVKILAATVENTDLNMHIKLIKTLGRMGTKKAGAALKKLFKSENMYVRTYALAEYGKMELPDTLDICIEMLKHKDRRMRQVSVKILGDNSSEEAVKWIIQVFNNDKSRLVRTWAVRALGKKQSAQTKKLLLQSLKDPYNEIRAAAIYGLAEYKSPQMIGVFLRIFNEDPDKSVRRTAISCLAGYDSPQVVRTLFRVFNNYPDFRETALKGLTRFESPQVVQLFVRAFDDELEWVRHTASTEFIKLKSPAAAKAAQKLLNHKDRQARDAAQQLLYHLRNKR